jgi:multidrug efflux system outer membrane protein
LSSSTGTAAPGGHAFNAYSVSLSASFELDVWGRLRRASESARASLLASEQGKGTVVLTVVATVATGYIQLLALDRQLEIARRTSDSLGEAAHLQRIRFEEGAVPESDYRQAESQFERLRHEYPSSSVRSRSRRISSAFCSVVIPDRSHEDGTSTHSCSRRA